MARFVAVIDIGKTNAKVAVVDSDNWLEVAVRTTPNLVLGSAPYPHFDIDGLWIFITSALRDLNQIHEISAISITTHGASAVLLDQQGALAMPMLDYEFDGPDGLAAKYDSIRPVFEETGSPRLAGGLNLGAQLYWQKETFPELFSKVQTIVTYPQYWAFRLTGNLATEVTSLGCHTDLWNPWKSGASSMAETFGWADLLAPLRKASDIIGNIQPEIANLCGISRNVSVVCGLHDSNASLYPHLLMRSEPFSIVSSGTWVICMAIDGLNVKPDPHRDTLVNVSAFGDAVPSARFMGGREYDSLLKGHRSGCTEAEITSILENGVFLLPSIEKYSGPFQGYTSKWVQSEPNGGERYAAVSFYLAMMTSVCLSLAGARGTTIVEGPFSRNMPYLKMLSAATGRPIMTSGSSATGTSVGAAMLVTQDSSNNKFNTSAEDCLLDCSSDGALKRYANHWTRLISAQ